jgi:hypothetical protein
MSDLLGGLIMEDNFKIKISTELIARYKDWLHIMFLVNGKFNNILIVKDV